MKTKCDKSYRLRNYCTFFVQFLHRSSFFCWNLSNSQDRTEELQKSGYQATKVDGEATSCSFLSMTVMATAPARQLDNKVCTRLDISSS